MTVGDACAPWHPQFFSVATFESQRLTQDGTTIDPGHGLRHCDVRIGEPRGPVLQKLSTLPLRTQYRLLWHVIAWGRAGISTPSLRMSWNLSTFSFSHGVQSHFMPATEKLSGRNMGHTCINFWAVGASKPSQNCDSDGVVCRDCFPGFSSAQGKQSDPCPRPGFGRVPSLAQPWVSCSVDIAHFTIYTIQVGTEVRGNIFSRCYSRKVASLSQTSVVAPS